MNWKNGLKKVYIQSFWKTTDYLSMLEIVIGLGVFDD